MATGFKNSSGVDMDALFLARVNAAGSNTGFKNASAADLATLFEVYTSGTKVAATGLKNSSGVDLADLFQNISVPLDPSVSMPANNYDWLRSNFTPASLTINSNGTITHIPIVGSVVTHTWLTGGTNSQVDMRITATGGSFSSGTTGTWLNMATSQTFTRVASAGAIQRVTFTLEFRNASTLAVIGTATGLKLTCDRV